MPYDAERHARLYYDASCGSCRLVANATQALSHGRVHIAPLDSEPATADLGSVSESDRYGSAHLIVGGRRRDGEEIVLPLVRVTFGPTAARLIARCPPIGRSLAVVYATVRRHRRCRRNS